MSLPPRPRAAPTGETGLRHDAPAWSSPVRQVPQGFEDPEASRGDGTEFVDDMIHGAMASGSYFTDLLVADVEGSPNEHGPAAAKGSQGRTKNFRDEEDRLLVSAWLNVGMNPIQGIEQSQTSFWARIHEYFHANESFEIEDRNQSGCSVDDKIAHACTLFKDEDKKKRKFALMHCWRIMKDKPKWMERRKQIGPSRTVSNKKQKTKANSSPSLAPGTGSVDAAAAQDSSKRPDGKKTEKNKLRQRSTIEALDSLVAKLKESDAEKEIKKEERCNKALALQEEKIKLEREKFVFQRELEKERILSLNLSNMSYRQQQYYEGRQNEILARRLGC